MTHRDMSPEKPELLSPPPPPPEMEAGLAQVQPVSSRAKVQTESGSVVARGRGEGRMGSDSVMGIGSPFGVKKIFWNWIEVMAAN